MSDHGSVFDVIQLHRDDWRAWTWMPLVLHRIGKFCEDFDVETLPTEAQEWVRYWFCTGDPRLGFWIVVKDDDQLVGHLWASPEPMGTDAPRYMLVRQALVNPGVDLRPEAKLVFEAMREWGKKKGLTKVVMATHRNQTAMARRWGFTPIKVVMRQELHDPIGPC
jgi:hypothetical protein